MNFDEVFNRLSQNPEFAEADRLLRPRFELANLALRWRLDDSRLLDQREMAALVGMTPGRYMRFELGDVDPTLGEVIKILDVLQGDKDHD